jgi:hypothetical protein
MEQFTVKFGTPRPVKFRETMGTREFDFDLEARAAGKVDVTDYDAEQYVDQEEISQTVKTQMPVMLEQCLAEMSAKSVMRRIGRDWPLPGLLEKKLSEAGITGKVEIISFVLTQESQETYDEIDRVFRERIRQEFAVDRTDRPCKEYLDKLKPDCVLETPKGFGPAGFFVMPQADQGTEQPRFCPACAAKRLPGAKFCSECGIKFEN